MRPVRAGQLSDVTQIKSEGSLLEGLINVPDALADLAEGGENIEDSI